MDHHQKQFLHMAATDQLNPAFAMYEHPFQSTYSGLTEQPAHFDGIAFWYKPEPQGTMFERNKVIYNHNMPPVSASVEPATGIKHRRTRSGCFTCRHRRVKCDETRPICERCKKGNRECHFPQSSSSSRRADPNDLRSVHNKTTTQENRSQTAQSLATIGDESEEEEDESASPAPASLRSDSESALVRNTSKLEAKRRYAQFPKTPKAASISDLDPRVRPGTPLSPLQGSPDHSSSEAGAWRWKHLNAEMQDILQFHQDNMTHYHYFLRLNHGDTIHGELVDMALTFEPLLNAVVGFAAYHYTLQKPDGRFKEFWKYYSRSIILLRKWLETHAERDEAVLFTILQLAMFEEYLGDWASLASHHKAAHSIFTTLYDYENVMATETSRCLFVWVARTDIVTSLMAATPGLMDRRWFTVSMEWHRSQIEPTKADPGEMLSYFVAKISLLGFDIGVIFANVETNVRTIQDIQDVSRRMDDLRLEIQSLHDLTCSVRDLPSDSPRDLGIEDAFDHRIPLFKDTFWPLNFIWIDWYATQLMLRYQTVLFNQAIQAQSQSREQLVLDSLLSQSRDESQSSSELEHLSLTQCQLFEAIEKSPHAPAGAVLGCQASLGLSTVFLRKEPRYTNWARRKLANIERMGYIWAPSFRRRVSQFWEDESILDWWLPSGEGKVDLLDEIRRVVEERNREIEVRGGDERDCFREMKALFEKMEFRGGNVRNRTDSVWSATGRDGGSNSATSETGDAKEVVIRNEGYSPYHSTTTGGGQQGAKGQDDDYPGRPTTTTYSSRMSGIWDHASIQQQR